MWCTRKSHQLFANMVSSKRVRLTTPSKYLAYCFGCHTREDELTNRRLCGRVLIDCQQCHIAKFCASCSDQTYTTAHYCREITVRKVQLKSLEASYIRSTQRPPGIGPLETLHLQEEVQWCTAQIGNCLVKMATETFPKIQQGQFLYIQALEMYLRILQHHGVSTNRRKAIESQTLLLLLLLDCDDQAMKVITKDKSADRYTLLHPEEIRNLTMESSSMPYILFCIKAKIVGLAGTMKLKLDGFLETHVGQLVDPVRYEFADLLYGYGQMRVRNQAAQIALVAPALMLQQTDGVPMVAALLETTEKFEKAEWQILFRSEVPDAFWFLFRHFVLSHGEIQSSLQFLATSLQCEHTTKDQTLVKDISTTWLKQVTTL